MHGLCPSSSQPQHLQVRSTLASVETPLGEDFVPDMTTIYRARQQDLNKTQTYPVSFTRNAEGRVVLDRRRNTADLVAQYYAMPPEKIAGRVVWDIENPNDLSLRLPRGGDVETRVTRRLQVRVLTRTSICRCPHIVTLCRWFVQYPWAMVGACSRVRTCTCCPRVGLWEYCLSLWNQCGSAVCRRPRF